MAIMREHAYHGYQILKKIPFLAEAAEIVYSHQERFDGDGLSPTSQRRGDSPGSAHLFHRRHASTPLLLIASTAPRSHLQAAREEIEELVGTPVRS